MNARRLIDALAEGLGITFEHELGLDLSGQPLRAVLYVEALVDLEAVASLSYQVIQVEDAAGRAIEASPELTQAIDAAFQEAQEELTVKAHKLSD